MAGLKRCLGVDLGSSRIKVAEVFADKNGVTINRLLQADVDIPPGTDDEERALRVSRAIRDLLKSNKVSTKDAVFSVPGQSVFHRPIKLPKTSDERLRRIIEYEARQQIPFPLDQTQYEFQVFESADTPDEVEVLLVAIKKETINRYVRLFRRTGLRIAAVGVSYLSLFNFHEIESGIEHFLEAAKKPPKGKAKKGADAEADDSGKGKRKKKPKKEKKKKEKKAKKPKSSKKFSFSFGKKKGAEAEQGEPPEAPDEEIQSEGENEDDLIPALDNESGGDEDLFGGEGLFEEVKAYVNLGATTMDLAIGKQGGDSRVGFCRSIPHAGNEMTRSIQKALSLDSFREAEEIKRSETAVLSSMFEIEGDEGSINRDASDAVTGMIEKRIIGELRRSLDFYISQPDGVAVDGIVLSGGQAGLPYLGSYIEEKLGLPVETVDEFLNGKVQVGEAINNEDLVSGLLSIGLAMQGVGASVIDIDFLPEDLKTVREFKGKYREVAAMVTLICGMVGLSYNAGEHSIQAYKDMTLNIEVPNVVVRDQMLQKFTEAPVTRNDLQTKYTSMQTIVGQPGVWLDFWVQLILEKPTEIIIYNVSMNSDGSIQLQGMCDTVRPISKFFDNLQARTDILADVELTGENQIADDWQLFNTENFHIFTMQMRYVMKRQRMRATPPPAPTGRAVRG